MMHMDRVSPSKQLLSSRPARFLSTVSYSLYLVHIVMLSVLDAHAPDVGPVVRAVLAGAMATSYATAMWLVVERPLAKFRKAIDARA